MIFHGYVSHNQIVNHKDHQSPKFSQPPLLPKKKRSPGAAVPDHRGFAKAPSGGGGTYRAAAGESGPGCGTAMDGHPAMG